MEKNNDLESLQQEVQRLTEENATLIEANEKLIARNMMLAEKLDIYYEVRGTKVRDYSQVMKPL